MLNRLLFFFLICAAPAHAQTSPLPNEADTRTLAERVVKSVSEGQWKVGWDAIRAVTVIPANEMNVAEAQITGETEKISTRFGKPTGYEFIISEKVGERLIRHQLLVHHEKAPIRWMLVFYRTSAGWVLTDFKFDANYAPLFPRGV
jgi:hypothetical protein